MFGLHTLLPCVPPPPLSSSQTYTEVTLNGELVAKVPHCDTRNGTRPMLVTDVSDVAMPDDRPLPPDYDGWEEYSAWNYPNGLDSFNGYFSVPDVPASDPDILYLFTGLQNINWIPKVSPQQTPFDIIQPVLQFPADGSIGAWSVKSWYVTLNAGAFFSDQLMLSPGDKVYGIMEREGQQEFLVSSVRASDQQATAIHPKNTRLNSQPWAYVTLEMYGAQGCDTYPTKPCEFTQMSFGAAPGNTSVRAFTAFAHRLHCVG